MIENIIKEIRTALNNELYIIALMGTLTLPDACGKAEFPKEKSNSNRYKKWIEKYVNSRGFGEYEYSAMQGVDADIIYKLRCNLLHQVTPNIENCVKYVEYFELVKVNIKRGQQYQYCVEEIYNKDNIRSRKISINIVSLCNLICDSAENYYRNNRTKFEFIKYNFVDVDYHTKSLFSVN